MTDIEYGNIGDPEIEIDFVSGIASIARGTPAGVYVGQFFAVTPNGTPISNEFTWTVTGSEPPPDADIRTMTVGNSSIDYGYDSFAGYGDLVPDDDFVRFQALGGGPSIRIQLSGYAVPEDSVMNIFCEENPGLGIIQLPRHSSITEAWALSGDKAIELLAYLTSELGNDLTWHMLEVIGAPTNSNVLTIGRDGADTGFKSTSFPVTGALEPQEDFVEVISFQGTHMRVRMDDDILDNSVIYISIPDEPSLEILRMPKHGSIDTVFQSNSTLALEYVDYLELQSNDTEVPINLDIYIPEVLPYSFDGDFDGATTYIFTQEGSGHFYLEGVNDQGTDWDTDIAAIPVQYQIGGGALFGNQGEGVQDVDQIVELVQDPDDLPGVQVSYWELINGDSAGAGRQSLSLSMNSYRAGITDEQQMEQIYTSQRMRLSTGFLEIESLPQIVDWLMIYESFTHKPNLDTASRFNINIHKDAGAGPAFFRTSMSYFNNDNAQIRLWRIASAVPVPIEEWFTLEVFFRKGYNASGRCWIAITLDSGGGQQVICDVQDITQHPTDPDRTESWMFMKDYTIDNLVDELTGLGHPLAIWYGQVHIDNTTDPTGD